MGAGSLRLMEPPPSISGMWPVATSLKPSSRVGSAPIFSAVPADHPWPSAPTVDSWLQDLGPPHFGTFPAGRKCEPLDWSLFPSPVSVFLGFTPDGQSLVEARTNGTIRIWDVTSGKEKCYLAEPPRKRVGPFLAFSAPHSARMGSF